MNVPKTYILNNKYNLKRVLKKKKARIVSKSLTNTNFISYDNDIYLNYTDIIYEEDLEFIPDVFNYTIFQEEIEKEFEIRSFFIDGKFYSMAIFSQSHEQTKIDFRKYNLLKPNRNIPFILPSSIEIKLAKFLSISKINSGSFDLIKSKNGKYYFLEINPYGQYDMVSLPCNYNIDKIISELLILKNEEKRYDN